MDVQNAEALAGLGGVEGLSEMLGTDLKEGLEADAAALAERRAAFGSNEMPPPEAKTWLDLFIDSFDDATLIVLIVSAIVSLGVGLYEDPAKGWIEGAAILAAVLIVAIVTACNDYSKELQFRKLNAVKDDVEVKVQRGGGQQEVNVKDVVVGDVILLESGDKIPADAVVCPGSSCTCDESSLTGEPEERPKSAHSDPFLLSGCQVTDGSARAMAIAVGRNSRWGRIKASLAVESADTPLQEKLEVMANTIGMYGGAMAAITAVVMVSMWYCSANPEPPISWENGFEVALEAFILAVTIVVVAVPEGLPLAVTISLAYSTTKMMKDNNLIRQLAACETMGNATSICSDKTGTLTQNRMTVVHAWAAGGTMGDGEAAESVAGVLQRMPSLTDLLVKGMCLNSTAQIRHNGDGSFKTVGSTTEGAMLHLAQCVGSDYAAVRAEASERIMKVFGFSSARKRMSTIVRLGNAGGRATRSSSQGRLYVKGASEIVLERSDAYTDASGAAKKFTAKDLAELRRVIASFEEQALRVVIVAHRDLNGSTPVTGSGLATEAADEYEQGLCVDAVLGILDPLRPDVTEAVATCKASGISVRMVTGDSKNTAIAIAKKCGILSEGGLAMEGRDFRRLTPAQLDDVIPRLQVLARSSPQDKLILVTRLNGANLPASREEWEEAHPGRDWDKENLKLLPGHRAEWEANHGMRPNGVGEVVGVTGDGTNDAPALKGADVGLSMGLSGTDVAKDASDIIIMDDNFSSIVKAVLWGRTVFDNIRKFLQFQLTVNVTALVLTLLSAMYGYEPPLNAVQMLWVNLIMDTMGALALGTESPDAAVLGRSPYKRDASLVSRPMWRNVLVQSAFQLAILLHLLINGAEMWGVEDGSVLHYTLVFNVFVFCQVFNEFNARSIASSVNILKGILSNVYFIGIIVFTVAAQYGIVTYGGDWTKTAPLTDAQWVQTVTIASATLPLGLLMRFLPVSENKSQFAKLSLDEDLQGKAGTTSNGGYTGVVSTALTLVLIAGVPLGLVMLQQDMGIEPLDLTVGLESLLGEASQAVAIVAEEAVAIVAEEAAEAAEEVAEAVEKVAEAVEAAAAGAEL